MRDHNFQPVELFLKTDKNFYDGDKILIIIHSYCVENSNFEF